MRSVEQQKQRGDECFTRSMKLYMYRILYIYIHIIYICTSYIYGYYIHIMCRLYRCTYIYIYKYIDHFACTLYCMYNMIIASVSIHIYTYGIDFIPGRWGCQLDASDGAAWQPLILWFHGSHSSPILRWNKSLLRNHVLNWNVMDHFGRGIAEGLRLGQ